MGGGEERANVQKPCVHIHAKTMCVPMCKVAAMSMEYTPACVLLGLF